MQKTNAKNTNPPAISSATIPRAKKPAAAAVSPSSKLASSNKVTKVSPPPPQLSALWAAASSSDEEEEAVAVAVAVVPAPPPPQPASKKGKYVKGRAASKNKYLVPRRGEEDQGAEGGGNSSSKLMSGAPEEFGLPAGTFDAFADAEGEDAAAGRGAGGDYVHVRVQQRNGRKTLTTVQGIGGEYNYAKVLRDLKRELCCNGNVVEDKELGKIIQLQGDHRNSVSDFLAKAGMVRKDNIKVHGF